MKYKLKMASKTRIDVFDLAGRYITKLMIDERTAGVYNSQIDLSSSAPGVYLVRIITESGFATSQIIRSE
ncbi:MAG: T9SS type A sorting domain-containing protein [Sphingobacteriaceae bacterium]|nr:T9SS type A sorting domain-containing protein [Sphingobacteriaceae bacterium]